MTVHFVMQVVNKLHATNEKAQHIYANDDALVGFRSNEYQKCSSLVFDLLNQELKGGAIQEGKRKIVGVLEYDAERFAETGDWGFSGQLNM